jgi:hypothetical protein
VLPGPIVRVANRSQFRSAAMQGAVGFVDLDQLPLLEGATLDTPIVAIVDCKPNDTLAATIRALETHPNLCHVLTASAAIAARMHAPGRADRALRRGP